jgi:MarR-like DNA-binding transcriptional regulator SgrR of sgrS sRNA
MTQAKRIATIFMAICFCFAIKTRYGGEILIRLNEPASFTFSSSNYSDIIFYALIHENLFFLKSNNEISTHIFEQYSYDRNTKTLSLRIKDNLSFSDGSEISEKEIRLSLNLFLNKNLLSAKKLRRIIKNIKSDRNQVFIELLYDRPDILGLLTVPELVLVSGKQTFSGIFYPHEWVKDKYISLKPNKFYPGGRTYLDGIKVVFTDEQNSDIFLGEPGAFKEHGYREYNSGIYQNVYICFPNGDVGNNTRSALYTMLREFYHSRGASKLNSLTSDEESPVTININKMSSWRMKSVLKYSKINLYVLSSLKSMETVFEDFLRQKGVSMEIIYISENQLVEYLNNTPIKFLLLEKVFSNRMTLEEKVVKILQEMSFGRFDEKYLKAINELDELKYLQNEELLMDHIAIIIEQIINDGIVLPLSQKRYSLFIKEGIRGVDIDYYGRPLFQTVRFE